MDFYWLEDQEKLLMSLSYNTFETLDNAALELSKKTGLMIDPYGTTRLAPEHAKILVNAIDEQAAENGDIEELKQLLDKASSSNQWLLIEGD